jgi:hypothetical protein
MIRLSLLSIGFFVISAIFGALSLETFNALTCDEEQEYCIAWPEALLPNGVKVDGKPLETQTDCADRVDQCSYFASNKECTNNPGKQVLYIYLGSFISS